MLTVSEFALLAQPTGSVRQELHHGEVVQLPPVKKIHIGSSGFGVDKEFPFRPLEEHEVWVADVAVFRLAQWEQTADDDYFQGVPPIVIEVLSPSNTASEMLAREEVCLRNGGREFWLVDPQRETVKVIHAAGSSQILSGNSHIQSEVLGGPIPLEAIFSMA
jgi:Uma2 family endonuclease